MNLSAPVVADESVADGEMRGFDERGTLIVSMRYTPVFERTIGTEDDEREVHRWHISPAGVRRIAAIGAWSIIGDGSHPTQGNA